MTSTHASLKDQAMQVKADAREEFVKSLETLGAETLTALVDMSFEGRISAAANKLIFVAKSAFDIASEQSVGETNHDYELVKKILNASDSSAL